MVTPVTARNSAVGLLVIFSIVYRIECDVYASNSTHILKINEETGAQEVLYPSDSSQAIGRAVGLAVDIGNNLLFWSDIDPNTQGIYKYDLTRNRVRQIYAPSGFNTEINGLSVDWIHNHVYFTDAIQRTVEVMEYDGSNRYIVAGSELQQPRGVLADPIHNALYWNDQQTQKLETSRLDGSHRQTLLDVGLKWPNQMAFDYSLNRLFFVDGWNKTINSIAPDGGYRRTVLEMTESSMNPLFGLAVTRDRYFVSIWHKGVSAVNRTASSAPFTAAIGGDTVFGLATDNVHTQPSGSSVCTSSLCSHLCLPTIGSSPFVCKCPSYSGLALSSDTRTCKVPDEFLLAALPDAGIVGFMAESGGALHYVGRSPRPVAVAYDPVNKMVYWSDVTQGNIHRAKLDGSEHEIFLNSSDSVGVVDGMVFDVQNGRLYFTNMGFVVLQNVAYTWHRIEMIGREKDGRKVVVADTERPRGLDLDRVNGYLYYTDWGTEARVVRVDLDGSNPKVMLQGLSNPNGVAVGGDGYVHVVDSNFEDISKNATLYKVSNDGRLISTKTDKRLKVPYGISYRGRGNAGTVIISDWLTGTLIEYPNDYTIADLGPFGGVAAVLVVNNVSVAQPSASNRCAGASCDDICIPEPSGASPSYSCSCDSYSVDIQGILRKSSQCAATDKFLMFADMNAIKMVSLDSMQDHTAYSVVEGDSFLSNFVGLAYDPSSNMIYFSDVNYYTIYRANADGSNRVVFYKPGEVVDGLTVADGRLFWTSLKDGLIASVALSGDNSTYQVVVRGLDHPRAIVASTGSGSKYLFFTEWGRAPSVSRYDLQNKHKIVLIGSQLEWPNGLHYDQRGGKLYVADGQLRKVFTVNPDGANKTELSIPNLPHIYDIKVLDDYLFLTSWNSSALYVVDLLTKELKTVASGLMRPTQMVVQFDPSLILGCPVDLECDECKYIPGLNMMCTCEDGSHLGPDGHTCIANTASVVPISTTLSPIDAKYKPLYCPDDIHVVTSHDKKRVSFTRPDFVGDPSVTQTHKAGSEFKVGTTKVTFIAVYKEKTKDGAPRRVRCSFNIIVEKKDLPCGELPVVTNGNFKCSGSECSVECFGRYRARDPAQRYTCKKKKWTPSLGDGFGLLACYDLQLPQKLTYSIQINLAGSCLRPVDQFTKDLQNEVVKQLNNKNIQLCSTQQVKCSLSDVSVNCGRIQRSARDVDGGIDITMTMVAVFLSNKHSNMTGYDRLKEFWTAHLLAYLQSVNLVVHDQHLTVTAARAALKSALCPPGLAKVGSGCAICPAATYLIKKVRECRVCSRDTYQPQPGQDKCLPCKKGSTAQPGSKACITSGKRGAQKDSGFPTGSVVGGIFGALACIALVVIVVLFIRHRRLYGGHLPINFNNPSYEEYENSNSGTEFENPTYSLRASYSASEEKTALSSF